ncbi:MAG: MFS transporter [Pseudomonadota bacterium]
MSVTSPSTPRATADSAQPRNIIAELLHGLFGQAGQRLFMAPTFLPAFLFALSGSEIVVGAARAIQAAGAMLSPTLGAAVIGHRTHIKWIGIGVGLIGRSQILLVALAVCILPANGAVALTLAALGVMGFANGFGNVSLNVLRARVIPVNRRGVILGLRNTLGGLVAAAMAAWAGTVLLHGDRAEDPQNYVGLFVLAFCVGSVGLSALALTREPESVEVMPQRDLRGTVTAARALVRNDPDFAAFFFAYGLGNVSRMGLPFYVLYAGERLEASGAGLTGALLGALTTLWLLSGTCTRLIWGSVGDRHGHGRVIVAGLALWVLGQGLLIAAFEPAGLMAAFVILGVASGGFHMGSSSLVLELGATATTPLRVAAVTTFGHAVAAVAPLLGGLIGAAAGYPTVFALCMAAQAGAIAFLLLRPPRQNRQPFTQNHTETVP